MITIDDKMHSSMLNFEDDTPENSGDEEHVFNYKEVKDEHEVAPSKPDDLTLQEMCHIRSQMTRAELEQKNLTKDERIDLDKVKVYKPANNEFKYSKQFTVSPFILIISWNLGVKINPIVLR